MFNRPMLFLSIIYFMISDISVAAEELTKIPEIGVTKPSWDMKLEGRPEFIKGSDDIIIVTKDKGNTIQGFSLNERKIVWEYGLQKSHYFDLHNCSLIDGQIILMSRRHKKKTTFVQSIDISSGREKKPLIIAEEAISSLYAAGQKACFITESKKLVVIDAKALKITEEIPFDLEMPQRPMGFFVRHNGDRLVFGVEDVYFCADITKGKMLWHKKLNIARAFVPHAISSANTFIYQENVKDRKNIEIKAINLADGKTLWEKDDKYPHQGPVYATEDTVIYFPYDPQKKLENNIIGLDAKTGAVKWKWWPENKVFPDLRFANNMVFVQAGDGLYCINPKDGSVVWKHELKSKFSSYGGLTKNNLVQVWGVRSLGNGKYAKCYYALTQAEGKPLIFLEEEPDLRGTPSPIRLGNRLIVWDEVMTGPRNRVPSTGQGSSKPATYKMYVYDLPEKGK